MEQGKKLDGDRYVVGAVLGEGAQGVTYAGTDTKTGEAVAIKRFDVRGARSWKELELAEREIRVLASLDHPLVPKYVGHFEQDGALYLVMERVEGESLEAIRAREGALPEAEVRRFLACADRALSYLHGRGQPVVHRDIKPSNVVRRPDGSYVLIDFGTVAELLRARGASTIVGTAGYMAPEQVQGQALAASDVYAVGATALAALTGRDADTLPRRGLRIDVLAAAGDKASPELLASIERMLEPDPESRAQSLAAALDTMTAASVPPRASAPQRQDARVSVAADSEDAVVRSLRRLLWALWGVGWVLVPMVFGKLFGLAVLIPIVMFGWMAAILVATWHRGALLRAGVRWWRGTETLPTAPERKRIAPDSHRVRVHATDLGPEEEEAGTEVQHDAEAAARRRGAP